MRSHKIIGAGVICLITIGLFVMPGLGSSLRHHILDIVVPIRDSAWGAARTIHPSQNRSDDQPQSRIERSVDRFRSRSRRSELRSKLLQLQRKNTKLKRRLKHVQIVDKLSKPPIPLVIPARVLPLSETSPWRYSVIIDRGITHGVVEGNPIVFGEKLLGQIAEVGERSARVKFITDPDFRLTVKLVPPVKSSNESRSKEEKRSEIKEQSIGVLQGKGADQLVIEDVLSDADVQSGWKVLTTKKASPEIPSGLIIGKVYQVSDNYGKYLQINVRPAIRTSQVRDLPEVFILQMIK